LDPLRASIPVFTDGSGRRATVLSWLALTMCAGFVIVGGAIAFTLVTHVPLPGLGGLLSPPSAHGAATGVRDGKAAGARPLGSGLTTRFAGPSSVAAPSRPGSAGVSQVPHPIAAVSTSSVPGAAATTQVQATPAAMSPTKAPHASATSNPHATAKSANSHATPNAHATAKSANSQSTPNAHATAKSANSRAASGRGHATPTSIPTK
jgi:hypothetical protein